MGVRPFELLTCGVFYDRDTMLKRLWIFLQSCEHFGYDPQIYGVGRTFPDYITMKLDWQLEHLKTMECEYVLYTDSWDAFMSGGQDEVWEKYTRLRKPDFLASAFFQLGNSKPADYPSVFDDTNFYPYPNVGGWMGRREAAIATFERMVKEHHQTGDDCFSWYDAMKAGWWKPKIDHDCEIFHVSNNYLHVREEGGRLHNTYSDSTPCVIHLSGGYTDPVTGKDDRLLPWAKKAGVVK